MEKLNIVLVKDASYGEVVDTIADVIEGGILLETTLSDGFQFTDLLAAASLQPLVKEVINDVPQFISEFIQLNENTAKAAVSEARIRILNSGKQLGKVTNAILNFLYVAASNYAFAKKTYEGGQHELMLWQAFIGGGEVFPSLK